MKARDLIDKLSQVSPDAEVVPENKTESAVQLFDETFKSGNLVDLASSIGEVGIDSILSLVGVPTIVKDILVLGLLVGVTKTVA